MIWTDCSFLNVQLEDKTYRRTMRGDQTIYFEKLAHFYIEIKTVT